MPKNVLVVNDKADMGKSYYLPFRFFGPKVTDIRVIYQNPESIGLVVFTGGADVNPQLYQEPCHPKTHIDLERDTAEALVFKKAVQHNIPIFSICRGAQLITVLTGGKLIQHTNGHHSDHLIELKDGREFIASSSHHQMMLPSPDTEILGWAKPNCSQFYYNGYNERLSKNPENEVEVAYFKSIKSIGAQYHPEVMSEDSFGFLYVKELIETYLR